MSVLTSLLNDIFRRKQPAPSTQESLSTTLREFLERAQIQYEAGDLLGVEKSCMDAAKLHANNPEAVYEIEFLNSLTAAKKRFTGPEYQEWLAWFHTRLKPANYLEIGVETGQSLQFARAPTRAVGIDPAIQIIHSQETWIKLFKLTSDNFFSTHDPRQVFGSAPINLAFIDGLHTFDQALKDFINIERFSDTGTIVLFHDIFPVTPATARRERNTRFWIGDTWKVMLTLSKFRPDLKLFTIPTFPSGLGVVTNLNPASSLLKSKFDDCFRYAMELELNQFPSGLDEPLHTVSNDFAVVDQRLDLTKQ